MAADEVLGHSPSLGVLADQLGIDADPRAERAMAVLGEFGLSEPSPTLRSAVGVALVHRTYLYENQATLPDVTRGLLDALRGLGQTFLRKLATVDVYRRVPKLTPGSMSDGVNQITSSLPNWAARQAWLLECAALGRTFAGGVTPPAKVLADVCRQLIGVLCLAGETPIAACFLDGLLAEARHRAPTHVHDPKTVLEATVGASKVNFTYEREGSDHKTVYRATVTDTLGRRGVGVAPSKKHASFNAALDFLQRHEPHAVAATRPSTPVRRSVSTPVRRPVSTAIPAPRTHALMVRRLRDLFALPGTADALLSQALIHSSWAYENNATLAKNGQQDNQGLAYIGSSAAMYEHALNAAQQSAAEPPEEFAFRPLDNDVYSDLFHQAALAPGVLLGTGQATIGISVEMAATAFQAVLGAAFIGKDFPESLAPHWPTAWASLWPAIAPADARRADPTTVLQQTASVMRLQVEHSFSRSGPDHAAVFQGTTFLDSAVLSVRTEVTGAPSTSKTRAKHNASSSVLSITDRLSRPDFEEGLGIAPTEDRALARFLLAHQAAVLVTSSVALQSWSKHQLFGLHLATSPKQLLTWARNADRLLNSNATMPGTSPQLEEVFRAVLESAERPGDFLDRHLAHLLSAVEQLSAPEELSRHHLDQLVQLCNVYRCLGADDPGGYLSALAADWPLLYRDRVTINGLLPEVRVTGREWSVVDAAVATVLLPGATAAVTVKHAEPLRLQILTSTGSPPRKDAIERMCMLWSAVSTIVVLSPVERGVEVTITTPDIPAEVAPIARAVLAAIRPRREPYRAAMADLLHDMKNQLVAARQAASSPAVNETARLEQQLAAHRHLEQAQLIGLRLGAATSLLEPAAADTDSVELGLFLRHYGRTVFGWLPANIALSVPNADRVAHVAIDERALSAVLDNLMRNAVEAMREGGAISLAWASDQYEAVIELTDNGLGLPAEVVQALSSGKRIRSTKAGGNGLGLLGVQSLLRRVGGQLTVAQANRGTAWLITLPIAATAASEDS